VDGAIAAAIEDVILKAGEDDDGPTSAAVPLGT
jgi:hypothetical protein